ncbi:4-hydroxyphenylacetate 3-hydroxylase family protein [Gulosibacter chungangensis]|uniref:4-hydroxyphenylacetate 3-hydroxylase n=1 Tax=Gulosibacter chungangensis TaxID=979746 RepID=A0A7J5BFE4_9MICO|nr:4-hydroxyphenylacetate 3-hydroxylase family protein [Gulosibacter chungangensis]KAB1644954.1 4-hydroxyphenylacetate 3-hydroxylase [Gulosibacter chungangensis]
MLRSGAEYIDSIRDGRQVWIDGEKVEDVPSHPMFKPIVDIRARIYDLAYEKKTADVMTYTDAATGERCAIGSKPPTSKADWQQKRDSVDAVLSDVGGVVTRVGDETTGEMWSLFDGQQVLNEIDPQFSENIRRHVERTRIEDPFHVSANTDAKGNRAKWPTEQDPDVLLRVVKETDSGIIVRGAKFETAAAYANQAFVKPTIADWGNAPTSEYAVGFIANMNAKGLKFICRSGFAQKDARDFPLSSRFDEVDTMIIFDDVLIPWEDVLFYRHTKAAAFIRATLHRYSAFPYLQRYERWADLLLGTAYLSAQQTGVKMHQGVRENIAKVANYREMVSAHLTAAIETAQTSPEGFLMPNQQILFSGRALASKMLPEMVHTVRDISGCQQSLLPSASTFDNPEAAEYLNKYFAVDTVSADDRFKLLAFTRDLLNSDYATHRLTFQLFAQSPPFSHQLAVYNNYDFRGAAELVREAAGMSESTNISNEENLARVEKEPSEKVSV